MKKSLTQYSFPAKEQAQDIALKQGRPSPFALIANLPPNVLFVDLETTGLDAQRSSIVEIGARTRNGSCYYGLFRPWPGSVIEDGALEVNGRTRAELDYLPTSWQDGLCGFFDWLDGFAAPAGWIIAGLNVGGFDLAFLRASWARLGRAPRAFPFTHRALDIHTLAMAYAIAEGNAALLGDEPCKGLSNLEISKLLNIPEEARPHTALNGALWAAEATARLMEELEI